MVGNISGSMIDHVITRYAIVRADRTATITISKKSMYLQRILYVQVSMQTVLQCMQGSVGRLPTAGILSPYADKSTYPWQRSSPDDQP